MRLELYCTTVPLLPLHESAAPGRVEELFKVIAAEGYSGVEIQVSQILLIGKSRFIAALEASKLRFMGKVYSSGGPGASPFEAGFESHPRPGQSVDEHLAVWEASVRECCEPAELRERLVSISSQSGRDFFYRNNGVEADRFFSRALEIEKEIGVRVVHETHRHRLLFAPFLAASAVERFPEIRLLGDLSHYAVVCEANCGDAELEAAVEGIVESVRHVHLRVGYAEGPQVRDPRAPDAAGQLAGHARWWAKVWARAHRRGDAVVTATPEFLLPPYAREGDDITSANAFMANYARGLFDACMLDAAADAPLAPGANVERFIEKGQ
jgi:sugar phosphate isomerase/epimerase